MSQASTISAWSRDLRLAVVAIIAVATASAIGQLASYPNLAPWYAGLTKPSFNPPNWVFAPVWTTLYVMMAIALWRILRSPDASAARRLALTLFFIQLVLNAAWSWMFFGANNPLLGVITFRNFWSFSPRSSNSIGSIGWRLGVSCRSRSGLPSRAF